MSMEGCEGKQCLSGMPGFRPLIDKAKTGRGAGFIKEWCMFLLGDVDLQEAPGCPRHEDNRKYHLAFPECQALH